jgi:putative membrane protein
MMGFGMIGGMFLFWFVIVLLAILLVKGLFQSNSPRTVGKSSSARQILDERYARGEINQEQYQLMKKDIE